MARCTGKCQKQVFKIQNWEYAGANPDVANPEECPKRLPAADVKNIGKKLKEEISKDEILIACKGEGEGTKCGCSYEIPDWKGGWLKCEVSTPHTVGACKYTPKFTYQIKSRILDGGCVSIKYTSTAK